MLPHFYSRGGTRRVEMKLPIIQVNVSVGGSTPLRQFNISQSTQEWGADPTPGKRCSSANTS